MHEWLVRATEWSILLIDALALVAIVAGTLQAFVGGAGLMLSPVTGHRRREVWLRYARWLIVGLTFQLAAVALIRTFLNYFLERDLDEVRERQREPAAQPSTEPPA
jgi:uncharacterized membrane protein